MRRGALQTFLFLLAGLLFSSCYAPSLSDFPEVLEGAARGDQTPPDTVVIGKPVEWLGDMDADWKRIRLVREGLELDISGNELPCEPAINTKEIASRCYRFVWTEPEKAIATIWANYPEGGIFEENAIRAWFEGTAAGYSRADAGSEVVDKAQITFLGYPAYEMLLTELIEEKKVATKRLRFFVDGSEFVLSVSSSFDSTFGDEVYSRIKQSIKLTAVGYLPSASSKAEYFGVRIIGPVGWEQTAGSNAAELVRFRYLTKLIVLKAARQVEYQCANYRADVAKQFPTTEVTDASLMVDPAWAFTTIQPVPEYGIDLKVIHYCWNSRSGAVAMEGVSEEQSFDRWVTVFRGAAGTVHVP